jgi:hypothetical protein
LLERLGGVALIAFHEFFGYGFGFGAAEEGEQAKCEDGWRAHTSRIGEKRPKGPSKKYGDPKAPVKFQEEFQVRS